MPDLVVCQRCGLKYLAADIRKGAVCDCGQKLWRQPSARAVAPPAHRQVSLSTPVAATRALGAAPASAWRRLAAMLRLVPWAPVHRLLGRLAHGVLEGDWGRHPLLRAQGSHLTGLAWGFLALLLYRITGRAALAVSAYADVTEGARGLALSAIILLLGAALGSSAVQAARRADLSPWAPAAAMAGMASGLLLTFWAWLPGPLWLFSLILLPPALSWTGLLLGALAAGGTRRSARLTPHAVGVALAYMALVSGALTLPSLPLWSFARQARAPAVIPLCEALDGYRSGPPSARMWAVLTSEDQDQIRAELPRILDPKNTEGRRLMLRVIEGPDVADEVRMEVVESLIDTPGPQAAEMLARASYDMRSRSGSRAFQALSQGRRGFPDYAVGLAHSTETRTAAAGRAMIRAVSQMDELPALTRLAQSDRDPRVRAAACFALGNFRDPGLFDILMAATKDPDPTVRDSAVTTLSSSWDPRRLEVMIQASACGRWPADHNAMVSLGIIGDPRATRAILRYLAVHPDDDSAVEALSHPQAAELPELIKALKSPQAVVRRGVFEALTTSDDPGAQAAVSSYRNLADDAYRQQELQALSSGQDHDKYWQALLFTLRFCGPELRARALAGMNEYHKQHGDAEVGLAIQDRNLRVRQAATEVLDNGDPSHTRWFGMLLSDDDEGLRLRAVRTLVKLKAVSKANALAAALHMDKSPRVRKAVAEALGVLGTKDEENALREAARDDDDPAVRAAATGALAKIK